MSDYSSRLSLNICFSPDLWFLIPCQSVCGSENEVAPIPTEDDYFDVTNRKVQPGKILTLLFIRSAIYVNVVNFITLYSSSMMLLPGPIDYEAQRTNVFVEVVMSAEDQLCQRLAFGLSKIFATSTTMNSDSFNSGMI